MNKIILRSLALGIATALAVGSAVAATKSISSSSRSSSSSASSSSKTYSSSGRQTSKSTKSGNVTRHTSTTGRSLGKSTTSGNTTRHVNASGKRWASRCAPETPQKPTTHPASWSASPPPAAIRRHTETHQGEKWALPNEAKTSAPTRFSWKRPSRRKALYPRCLDSSR